ncbi:Probable calcium-binding protein CML22 [Linum grandiflorum]
MIFAALLLLLLFLAGLLNLNSYLPSKKLYAWLHSRAMIAGAPEKLKSSPVQAESSMDITVSKSEINKKKVEESEDEIMTSVFATFDKNGDGFITKQELKESLKNIRIIVTETEVEEMVVKIDSNGDGLIDLEEFKILCRKMSAGDEDEDEDQMSSVVAVGEGGGGELKKAFDVFDRNNDGLITEEELGWILSSLGLKEGKRMEDCKEMIRRVDVDGDGMVNFDEFKMMMRSGGGKLLLPVF